MNRSEKIHIFVKVIHEWYRNHKRTLPWRDLEITNDTQRAYQILVSEVMLQQTQVERVKTSYKSFLERFPTVKSLAEASNGEVIHAWRGMGYNSRALRLRDAAREVESEKWKMDNEFFPRRMEDLQKLPGIGHYTAAAIRNFAFNIPTACLDTNIRRIYHRAFIGPEHADGTWKKDDKYLLKIADEVLQVAMKDQTGMPRRTCATWHAALMDYGSLVCTMRSPKWDICPLTQAGVMKSAYRTPDPLPRTAKIRKEPGRMVGSLYIPNRIFRGKFVEELRDEPHGLTLEEVGNRICIDWDQKEHLKWLQSLAEKLQKDNMIRIAEGKVILAK